MKILYKIKKILVIGKYNILRLIPQGTVDKNLGPDCLAGLKAQDPKCNFINTIIFQYEFVTDYYPLDFSPILKG